MVIDGGKAGCTGCGGRCRMRVVGYRKRVMYEQRPVRRAETIGAQCPVRRCGGCGREEAVAEGTAVPLALFRPGEGDAAPEAGAGAGAAGASGDACLGPSPAAPAGGAAGDDGAVNDI